MPAETIHAYDAIAAGFAERWFNLPITGLLTHFAEQLSPSARVLDVGCGPARDTLWLAEQGFQAVGLDLSMGMLREGQARIKAQGVDVPLIQADMAHLPFRSGSFGGLWVCAVLLHIPKAQAGYVLRELARMLSFGHLYLSVKRGNGEAWVADQNDNRRFFAYYQPAELVSLVERSGFEVLESWESEDSRGRQHSWLNVLACPSRRSQF